MSSKKYMVIAGAGEAADSLKSKAMLSMLDLLGEGKIGGLVNGASSIYLDDTPILNPDGTKNFDGVVWEARDGTQAQTVIPGFVGTESPFQVGVKVIQATPHTVTITNQNATQVRVIASVPGLMTTDMGSGDTYGATVQYKVAISTDGGPFVDMDASIIWVDQGTWGTELGYLVASRAAGAISLGAGITMPGDGNCTVETDQWVNAAWVPFGKPLYLNRFTSTSDYGDSVGGNYSVYVESPAGAEKIRFRVTAPPGDPLTWNGPPTAPAQTWITSASVKSQVNTPVITISGKTRSKYERGTVFKLAKPGSTWSVRMTRITADSASQALVNDLYFESYGEITDAPLRYPNSALIGISLDSAQVSKVPNRSYLVSGLYISVPSNYDPETRVYTGIWDGTFKSAISDNPAWITYDLMTQPRYGLGHFIDASQMNKSKLYQIGRYCDELVPNGFGGTEPRFTINTAIQSQSEAFRLLSDLTSVFRGMGFWDGSMVGFSIDSPTDPSMVFSPANVIDGKFGYTGSARRDRHSVALITWNDPEESYKQKIEYVEDAELIAKYGVRKLETIAFGCTSRGQAHRAGLWMLYTEKFESDIISFQVGLDSAGVLPGDVVKIQDPYRAGKRLGGRLAAATLNSATFDAGIDLAGPGALLSVRLSDGTFEDRTVIEGPGLFTTVTWTTALSSVPLANAIWILAEANLQPLLARVVGITQDTEPNTFSVTAIEHNPSKYAAIELDLKLDRPRTSLLNADTVVTPLNPLVTEEEYVVVPGVVGTRLFVSWQGSEPSYELTWRRTGNYETTWTTTSTTTPSVVLDNVKAGTYEFSLVAVNGVGKRSAPPVVFSHAIIGHTTAPGDVVNFQARRRAADILLTWDAVQDIKVAGYEVRFGASWDSGVVLTTNFSGTSMTHDLQTEGTFHYHIRSIDIARRYSDNVFSIQLVIVAPGPVSNFTCAQSGSQLVFQWTANTDPFIVGYELREGATWQTAKLLTTDLAGTAYSTPAYSISGARTFWIKALVSPGVESTIATFVTTDVAMTSDRNVIYTDNELTNGWLGSKYQLSVIGGALQIDDGKAYGEYTWGVSLPKTFRARNSIDSNFGAVVLDSTTWAQANWSWASSQASRGWVPSGNLSAVNLTYYISKFAGLDASYVEGFGLNMITSGEKGTLATEAVGLTWQSGRFLAGALLGDFTRLGWSLAVPAVFNTTFWSIPYVIAGNQVYWVGKTATGLCLICGYDSAAGAFYLEDTLGAKISVPYALAVNDRVLIGIVQTATDRRLHVGALTKAPAYGTALAAPLGALTSVALNQ